MKRLICVFLAVTFILSLGACRFSGKNEDDTNSYTSPEEKEKEIEKRNTLFRYSDKNYHEEFKDSDGKVAYIIDFTYPEISGKISEEGKAAMTACFKQMVADLRRDAQANADNHSDFMKRFNVTEPAVRIITYKVYYDDKDIISLIFSEKNSSDEDVEPVAEGYTFSVAYGQRLKISSLYDTDATEEDVRRAIIDKANVSYSPNGVALDEEKIEIINSQYNEMNFVADDKGVTFLYSLDILSQGSRKGTYYCDISYDELEGILVKPAEFEK